MKSAYIRILQGLFVFCLVQVVYASENPFIELYSAQILYKNLLADRLECANTEPAIVTTLCQLWNLPEELELAQLAQFTAIYHHICDEQNTQAGSVPNYGVPSDENRLYCWLYHEYNNN